MEKYKVKIVSFVGDIRYDCYDAHEGIAYVISDFPSMEMTHEELCELKTALIYYNKNSKNGDKMVAIVSNMDQENQREIIKEDYKKYLEIERKKEEAKKRAAEKAKREKTEKDLEKKRKQLEKLKKELGE